MSLSLEQQKRLTIIDASMKQAELYAQYWMAMATTGAAARRSLQRGVRNEDGTLGMVELSDDEKIKDALTTALSHIDRIHKLAVNRSLVLENRLDELQP